MKYSLVLGALVAGVLAIPTDYVLHEKRKAHENVDIRRGDRLHADALVPVKIALQQSNLDKGYEWLMDISEPNSSNYGKHWTKEQVNEAFAPSEESVRTVKDWLFSAGISPEHVSLGEKGWLSMSIPAKQAEALFQTKYYEHHTKDGGLRLGSDEYYLPEHVSMHVDYIKPAVAMSAPVEKRNIAKRSNAEAFRAHLQILGAFASPKKTTPPTNATGGREFRVDAAVPCSNGVTGDCIRALYGIPEPTTSDKVNDLGIYESGASYSQADLNTFYEDYATNVPSGTGPSLMSVNGGSAPSSQSNANFEANIDFEMAYTLIYPQQTVIYQDGTPESNSETFLDGFLDYLDGSYCSSADQNDGYQCGAGSATKVISISYTQTELAITQASQQRSCNEIMKLTMQGITFVIASGDYGVASQPVIKSGYNGCYNPSNPQSNTGTVFSPTFPNNCPYVLSVGGTQTQSGSSTEPETAMFITGNSDPNEDIYFSSSGGFANYFPVPSYQQSAVSSYFSNSDPGYSYYTYNGQDLYTSDSNIGTNGGLYNRAGRGFPDVSANGAYFDAISGGSTSSAIGTSLAAPLWASIFTLINEQRTAAGKSSVGFVNPTLYANPSAFYDITSGTNPGCESNGFAAVSGWDPVTGLGTPNYQALLQIFANLD